MSQQVALPADAPFLMVLPTLTSLIFSTRRSGCSIEVIVVARLLGGVGGPIPIVGHSQGDAEGLAPLLVPLLPRLQLDHPLMSWSQVPDLPCEPHRGSLRSRPEHRT